MGRLSVCVLICMLMFFDISMIWWLGWLCCSVCMMLRIWLLVLFLGKFLIGVMLVSFVWKYRWLSVLWLLRCDSGMLFEIGLLLVMSVLSVWLIW